MTSRTSLTRHAPLMRDAQPLDDAERREMFRRAWVESEIVVLRQRDVPAIFWSVIAQMATRLYGERRT